MPWALHRPRHQDFFVNIRFQNSSSTPLTSLCTSFHERPQSDRLLRQQNPQQSLQWSHSSRDFHPDTSNFAFLHRNTAAVPSWLQRHPRHPEGTDEAATSGSCPEQTTALGQQHLRFRNTCLLLQIRRSLSGKEIIFQNTILQQSYLS